MQLTAVDPYRHVAEFPRSCRQLSPEVRLMLLADLSRLEWCSSQMNRGSALGDRSPPILKEFRMLLSTRAPSEVQLLAGGWFKILQQCIARDRELLNRAAPSDSGTPPTLQELEGLVEQAAVIPEQPIRTSSERDGMTPVRLPIGYDCGDGLDSSVLCDAAREAVERCIERSLPHGWTVVVATLSEEWFSLDASATAVAHRWWPTSSENTQRGLVVRLDVPAGVPYAANGIRAKIWIGPAIEYEQHGNGAGNGHMNGNTKRSEESIWPNISGASPKLADGAVASAAAILRWTARQRRIRPWAAVFADVLKLASEPAGDSRLLSEVALHAPLIWSSAECDKLVELAPRLFRCATWSDICKHALRLGRTLSRLPNPTAQMKLYAAVVSCAPASARLTAADVRFLLSGADQLGIAVRGRALIEAIVKLWPTNEVAAPSSESCLRERTIALLSQPTAQVDAATVTATLNWLAAVVSSRLATNEPGVWPGLLSNLAEPLQAVLGVGTASVANQVTQFIGEHLARRLAEQTPQPRLGIWQTPDQHAEFLDHVAAFGQLVGALRFGSWNLQSLKEITGLLPCDAHGQALRFPSSYWGSLRAWLRCETDATQWEPLLRELTTWFVQIRMREPGLHAEELAQIDQHLARVGQQMRRHQVSRGAWRAVINNLLDGLSECHSADAVEAAMAIVESLIAVVADLSKNLAPAINLLLKLWPFDSPQDGALRNWLVDVALARQAPRELLTALAGLVCQAVANCRQADRLSEWAALSKMLPQPARAAWLTAIVEWEHAVEDGAAAESNATASIREVALKALVAAATVGSDLSEYCNWTAWFLRLDALPSSVQPSNREPIQLMRTSVLLGDPQRVGDRLQALWPELPAALLRAGQKELLVDLIRLCQQTKLIIPDLLNRLALRLRKLSATNAELLAMAAIWNDMLGPIAVEAKESLMLWLPCPHLPVQLMNAGDGDGLKDLLAEYTRAGVILTEDQHAAVVVRVLSAWQQRAGNAASGYEPLMLLGKIFDGSPRAQRCERLLETAAQLQLSAACVLRLATVVFHAPASPASQTLWERTVWQEAQIERESDPMRALELVRKLLEPSSVPGINVANNCCASLTK